MSYDSLQIYGIVLTANESRIYGINLTTAETRMQNITINADNYYQGDIIVTDQENNAISGATISISSTFTPILNISGLTDSNGIFTIQPTSILNTTLTVEADGFSSYVGPLQSRIRGDSFTLTLSPLSGGSSKKIYTTNKGNVLINPNDTILIELD